MQIRIHSSLLHVDAFNLQLYSDLYLRHVCMTGFPCVEIIAAEDAVFYFPPASLQHMHIHYGCPYIVGLLRQN